MEGVKYPLSINCSWSTVIQIKIFFYFIYFLLLNNTHFKFLFSINFLLVHCVFHVNAHALLFVKPLPNFEAGLNVKEQEKIKRIFA